MTTAERTGLYRLFNADDVLLVGFRPRDWQHLEVRQLTAAEGVIS